MAYSIKKEDVIKYAPEALREFHLTAYEWIDNLHFTADPHVYLTNAAAYLTVARELFLAAGWDGDGEIGLIWIPPFMLHEMAFQEDARGVIIWHVKQEEDGISWLLSPIALPFP
ncbi:hypothetical protein [Chitinophaga nivalis]|uniref:Uncharacterized protein n=1 Tax=Chitinophaga nivalis TaxID=2991709 RepID=A0ABT3IMW1_9BACT|nr:hypothetical protein [Chitinophaga nivalis]MCW3465014.1 hypothetical protein [Chitinophaga nivalis]MCW3485294.1 hypothetical protein [Chitinophaga nivalis]